MNRPSKPAPKTDARRCAIYTRKSVAVDATQEFNTLDAQRESCAAFVERQPCWTVLDTRYDDGGFTGSNIDRPAFQRLLDNIDARKVDVVVVYKVDRLSRSLLDFAKVMERLNAGGASFVSVTQNFSTADAMGRLTLNMLMNFAEFEREMIADRTRDKVAAARRKGKWTGGITPFGYDLDDKHLVVNELEAIIVREAFDLLLAHEHISIAARLLNEQRHLPRGARLPIGKSPRWTSESLSRILRSPVYAGLIHSGGELHPGQHPALIDRATFDRVQLVLAGSGRTTGPRTHNLDYVLGGLLHCGPCGGAMTPGSTRKGTKEYRYYRCSTRSRTAGGACSATQLPAGPIEAYVVNQISAIASDTSFVASTTAALDRRISQRRGTVDALCRKLPGAIASYSANTSRFVEELTRTEGATRTAVEARLRVESERLAAAERQLVEAERDQAQLAGLVAQARWVATALADFAKVWGLLTTANRTRLLRALIDRIVVDEPSGKVEVHLIDFGADTETTAEAA